MSAFIWWYYGSVAAVALFGIWAFVCHEDGQ